MILNFIIESRQAIEEITPVDVIVLEGIFVLAEARVRDMCDIKIYCDTPDDIRFYSSINS